MSSWWKVNPGPERELIPTIKKKASTLSNLIAKKNYASIIRTILHYIRIFFNKLGFLKYLIYLTIF